MSVGGQVGDRDVSKDFSLEFTETDVSLELLPRLWAYQKVLALEEQIARFAPSRSCSTTSWPWGWTTAW